MISSFANNDVLCSPLRLRKGDLPITRVGYVLG